MAEQTINTVIVLRNDSTTAWESSSYPLKSGEVGVGYMERTVKDETGNAVIKKVPIIKVGDDTSAWKDLPQAEGVFEENQILTYDFGRHKTSNGFVDAGGRGMTTSEWLLDALSETKDPVVGQPTFTIVPGTITTTPSGNEIGSKITSVKWNGTFSGGSYEYGSKVGSNTYTETATGVTASYEMSLTNFAGTYTAGEDGTLTLDPQIEVASTAATEIGRITSTCSWEDSLRTPVNNIGTPVESKKIKGSSITATAVYSITGYREGFYFGGLTSKATLADLLKAVENATLAGDETNIASAEASLGYRLRTLPTISRLVSSSWKAQNKTGAKYTKGDYKVKIPVGTATIVFACPAANTGVTKVYNNTVNADMTTSFTKTANVKIGGADATEATIGKYAEAYNIWTFTPNEAYGTETELTITLG